MRMVIGVLLVFIGMLLVWFHIPYSPVKSHFQQDIAALVSENQLQTNQEVFTEEEFSGMPVAIQQYIQRCGYKGTPKMSYLKMEFKDVDFSQGKNGPTMTIDYTQYNFIHEPCRMALIDSRMYGIPFEGYDYYQNGTGGMKGVIAKAITLFDQTGPDMDQSCLATFLAESVFAPAVLLQDYITFEEISAFEVRATIRYKGQTASGIFTFNEEYEMTSFTTEDRAVAGTDGSMEYVQWSARCTDYEIAPRGIKRPTRLQAVWNYPDGDFVYFDGVIRQLSYGYSQ